MASSSTRKEDETIEPRRAAACFGSAGLFRLRRPVSTPLVERSEQAEPSMFSWSRFFRCFMRLLSEASGSPDHRSCPAL
jgi:hypothetical protein